MSGPERGYIGFGLSWHWGDPNHPTEIASDLCRSAIGGNWTLHSVHHPIRRWYGLSHQSNWVLVLCLLGQREDRRTPVSNSEAIP